MSPARSLLAAQLAHPRGFFGRQAAREMAVVNGRMIACAIELLEVTAGHRVLEIGFGGGKSLGTLAARSGGPVIGVDLSATMVQVATRRHRGAIRAGRISVHEASASSLPLDDGTIDRVLSVNSLPYWDDVPAGMAEIARVMVPGARAVLSVRTEDTMRMVGASGEGITLLDADGLRRVATGVALRVVDVAHSDDKLGGALHLVAEAT